MDAVFGKQVGQYILLEKLGEGGMASVYNAYDIRHERNIALKLILPSRQTSQLFLERFAIEARALAQLSHGNIVRVLDYGEADGVPYLVMEYISGGTLKEIMGNPIPWAQAAAILAPIARALEYVHRQKIIHRDVKPSNILLDESDTPLLSDFGVVKLLEANETPDMLATGVGIGTPDYMSPEQGMGKEVDHRADIYALGVVLYEMISGQKPFTAETPMAVVIQHVTGNFPHPKASTAKLPDIVDRVVMKAVAKDPDHRFQRMGDFAEALEQLALGKNANLGIIRSLLSGKRKAPERPVFQPNAGETMPAAAPARKKPAVWRAALAVGITLLALAGLLFTFRGQLAALVPPGILPPALATAFPIAQINLFGAAPAASATANGPTETPRPIRRITATNQATATETATPTLSPTPLPTFTASPTLAPSPTPTATSIPPAAADSPISILRSSDRDHLTLTRQVGIGGVNSIGWGEGSNEVILGTTDGIFAFNAQSLERVWNIDTQGWVNVIHKQSGSTLLAGLDNGNVGIWSASAQLVQKTTADIELKGKGAVSVISTSADERLLAIGWQNGAFAIFERKGSAYEKIFEKTWAQRVITGLAFNAAADRLYLSANNTLLEIWDVAGNKQPEIIDIGTRFKKILVDGDNLLLYGQDQGLTAVIYNIQEKRNLYIFSNVGAPVITAAISGDHQWIAFGLLDGRIKIYRFPTPENPKTTSKEEVVQKGHPDAVTALAFSPDNKTLASASHQRSLVLWDLAGTMLRSLDIGRPAVQRMAFSPDGNLLAVQFGHNSVILFNIQGEVIKNYEGILPEGAVFSSTGRYMIVAQPPDAKSSVGKLLIVHLPDGEIIQTLNGYKADWAVSFSEDERLLASGYQLAAFIWDTSTWQKVETRLKIDSGCGIFRTPEERHLATFWHSAVIFNNTAQTSSWCSPPPEFASPLDLFADQSNAIFQLQTGELWIWDHRNDYKNLAIQAQDWPTLREAHTLLAVDRDDQQMLWNRENKTIFLSPISPNITTHTQLAGLMIENIGEYDYRGAIAPGGKLIAIGSKFGTVSFWIVP